jgi:hypothetical protein
MNKLIRIKLKLTRAQRLLGSQYQSGVSWALTSVNKLLKRSDLHPIYRKCLLDQLDSNLDDAIDDVSKHWKKLWPDVSKSIRLNVLDLIEQSIQIADQIPD